MDQFLIWLDKQLYEVLLSCVDIMPSRLCKLIANYYTDARIRKLYWKKLGIEMGEGTFANLGLAIAAGNEGKVLIGNNVSIAPNVTFVPCSEPNNGIEISKIPFVCDKLIKTENIIVEDEVWIGANVTVLPGCHIGRCSVIGAGAVVTGDIEPYHVYAGVPAKKIRNLVNR